MELPAAIYGRRALLVVAHPGHELRVHGWLERVRPSVWVLTDGSGHDDRGRLASTAALLARAGASPGGIFGRLSDRAAYEVIMQRDVTVVAALVDELATAIVDERAAYVAGDACEGFNPVHDLCRLVIDAAVLLAARRAGVRVDSYEFPLDAAPDWQGGGEVLSWRLDDAALERKLGAARAYAELADEVERAVARHGADAFRCESLTRAEPLHTLDGRLAQRPQYERFGEERVAAGHYTRVLRYGEHFQPLTAGVLAHLHIG